MLTRHIASFPQYVHSICPCHYPVGDDLAPISHHLGKLRRRNPDHSHAAQDTIVQRRIWKTINIESHNVAQKVLTRRLYK